MDIRPGTTVTVEITAPPRNEPARKTLQRLFRRDPQGLREHRRQKRQRPSWQTWRRGGRMWHHQMKAKPPMQLVPGCRLSLLATVDTIRDLQSVQRFVKVTAK
jgi:hypothetical protein